MRKIILLFAMLSLLLQKAEALSLSSLSGIVSHKLFLPTVFSGMACVHLLAHKYCTKKAHLFINNFYNSHQDVFADAETLIRHQLFKIGAFITKIGSGVSGMLAIALLARSCLWER